MFNRKAIGLELSSQGLNLSLVGGSRRAPRLEGYHCVPLPPEMLRFSRKEENVLNQQRFVSLIREAHLALPWRGSGVSLSLPDACGRVVLLDLEARLKNREEGLDVIRWKLKKSLPYDIGSVHLDYQLLAERENGSILLLVSLIAREVVSQYEELLLQAGIEARVIDFTSFNIYRLFANRLELSENGALVTYYGGALTLLIFHGGVLSFYRSKELPADGQALYREVNSSLLVYGDMNPGQVVGEVFCLAAAAEAEPFRAVVAEASGMEPVLLDPQLLIASGSGVNPSRETFHALSGSLGAALRSL